VMSEPNKFVFGPFKADDIDAVTQFITSRISANARTLLRLDGELGAGKTFLVSKILHALGLNDRVPVQSPTFALMHEYRFGQIRAAHLDLYRLKNAQDLGEVTGADFDSYNLVFVEWSDRMSGGFDPDLTVDVQIRQGQDSSSRIYEIFFGGGQEFVRK
jgi:tRNA threonylcarbamoyladenosine biosynthesis protein TsaE